MSIHWQWHAVEMGIDPNPNRKNRTRTEPNYNSDAENFSEVEPNRTISVTRTQP